MGGVRPEPRGAVRGAATPARLSGGPVFTGKWEAAPRRALSRCFLPRAVRSLRAGQVAGAVGGRWTRGGAGGGPRAGLGRGPRGPRALMNGRASRPRDKMARPPPPPLSAPRAPGPSAPTVWGPPCGVGGTGAGSGGALGGRRPASPGRASRGPRPRARVGEGFADRPSHPRRPSPGPGRSLRGFPGGAVADSTGCAPRTAWRAHGSGGFAPSSSLGSAVVRMGVRAPQEDRGVRGGEGAFVAVVWGMWFGVFCIFHFAICPVA